MGFRSAVKIRVRRQKLKSRDAARVKRKVRRVIKVDARKEERSSKPSFFRFAASSLTCTAIDQVLAWVLFSALRRPMADLGFLRILVANLVARCVSLSLNYVINHRLVFVAEEGAHRRRKRESFPRYVALAAFILSLSTLCVYFAHEYFGVEEWQAKLVADFLLFFLNYQAQQKWVFKTEVTIPVPKSHA